MAGREKRWEKGRETGQVKGQVKGREEGREEVPRGSAERKYGEAKRTEHSWRGGEKAKVENGEGGGLERRTTGRRKEEGGQ